MREIKYISAYLIPLCCLIGLHFGGALSWLTVVFAFVVVPILDLVLPKSKEVSEVNNKTYNRLYDWFLYFNIAWVYGLLIYAGVQWSTNDYSTSELIGMLISLGFVMGVNGINVAHELGHRNKKFEQVFAQILLLPEFYMHFYIEHNHGHHRNVATPLDPASAKKGDFLYIFWLKSVILSYVDAWKIQSKILQGKLMSVKNNMLWYVVFTAIYLSLLFFFFDVKTMLFISLSGVVGMLLLETINYIEHYGLSRNKLDNGRYERVSPKHSWNANYTFGRIILFELTRHSDHHYRASKKYHTLEHKEEAPELPFGYPAAIICSLFPWIWFSIMHKRLSK
ncbi:alkane 1-monooxygenase [Flammeovirga pacifica]|uniref:Alkane 1-monooxygenase n=1 Tax=Flammeovirga pacifica TaxID=915059 RepID=A0A1S1YUU8_FLAPC|nr:alkane 1-monooxygenase [Flammeovirga pacifica]